MEHPPPKRWKRPRSLKPDNAWYAVMVFREDYSGPITDEDRMCFHAVKEKAAGNARVLDYLALAENSRSRFSWLQAEAVAEKYLRGDIPEEYFRFQERVLQAWEQHWVDELIEEVRASLVPGLDRDEAARLDYLLDLARDCKDEIIQIVAITALKAYFPKTEVRHQLLEDGVSLLETVLPGPFGLYVDVDDSADDDSHA
jgi:hypothetical protein